MSEPQKKDFILQAPDGEKYVGTHLLIDVLGSDILNDIETIREMMLRCVQAAGATLLHIHLHHFSPNGGVSGVAVLAESHISIHTWPEHKYAALDVFMCGDAQPLNTIAVIEQFLAPTSIHLSNYARGSGLLS